MKKKGAEVKEGVRGGGKRKRSIRAETPGLLSVHTPDFSTRVSKLPAKERRQKENLKTLDSFSFPFLFVSFPFLSSR